MINLEEHKVYIESHKLDMVPLKVALQAVEQARNKQLDQAISKLSLELTSLKPDLTAFND
jgi:hypothetical protein